MSGSDYERTFVHGDAAMGYLRTNKTPAYPANYELWYTYSCGYNKVLNNALNELLAKNGSVTPADTQRIYEEFLSPIRLGNRFEEVGSLVNDEITEITNLLDLAVSSAGEYGETLRGASEELSVSSGATDVAAVVRTLVAATRTMLHNNTDLENKLRDSKQQIHELRESIETIRNESLTDQLTGIANRKHFDGSLTMAIEDAVRDERPLCLLLCDIDHFKKFNDTYGHQTGDQVLRLVGSTLRSNVKGRDLAARYGGEEFAIILPQTDLAGAKQVAEQIRNAIRNKELIKRSSNTNLGRITMSLGVVQHHAGDTVESLVHRADMCLYAAKAAGRDCIRAEKDVDEAKLSDVA